jgi:hypothetical protein
MPEPTQEQESYQSCSRVPLLAKDTHQVLARPLLALDHEARSRRNGSGAEGVEADVPIGSIHV